MILDQPVRIFIFLYSYIFSFIWIHLIYMSKVAFVASDLKQNNHLYLRQVWFGDQLSRNYAFPRHYFSEIYPQLQIGILGAASIQALVCFQHLDANEILHINE